MTHFLAALVSFVILDTIWLGFVAKTFYRTQIGHLMNIQNGELTMNWLGAGLVYVLLALGVTYFVMPASTSVMVAATRGAVMGLVVYGVYDMTNLAILKGYGWKVSIADMVWGMVATGAASAVAYWISHR